MNQQMREALERISNLSVFGDDVSIAINIAEQALAASEPPQSGWVLREVYFDEDGNPAMHREPAVVHPSQSLLKAATKLANDLHDLIGESEGVLGLHRNGDVADWESLMRGGQFEDWLKSLDELDEALISEENQIPDARKMVAPAVTDRLTIQKTSELCIQHDYKVTGYILSNADGVVCTVNMSNVQWFNADRPFPSDHTNHCQPAVVQQIVDALKQIDSLRGPFMSESAVKKCWEAVDSALEAWEKYK